MPDIRGFERDGTGDKVREEGKLSGSKKDYDGEKRWREGVKSGQRMQCKKERRRKEWRLYSWRVEGLGGMDEGVDLKREDRECKG